MASPAIAYAADNGTAPVTPASLVSVTMAGTPSTEDNHEPSISADGRYVAFESDDPNLVPGDTNGKVDSFVRDRQTGVTTRVSVSSTGAEGNGYSATPIISGDGRYVAFQTESTNLVPGGTLRQSIVLVHDRETGATTEVSLDSAGVRQESVFWDVSMSADGRYVGFEVANGTIDVRDRQAGTTTRVNLIPGGARPNKTVWDARLSPDGGFVTFWSAASNVVSGDTNGVEDVFVHDRQTSTTTRVSLGPGGVDANGPSDHPSISTDGRYVAFQSRATNLLGGDTHGFGDVYVHDRQTGGNTRVRTTGNFYGGEAPSISADGRYVAVRACSCFLPPPRDPQYPDDMVFVYDQRTDSAALASVDPGGSLSGKDITQVALSADGRHVAFNAQAKRPSPFDPIPPNNVYITDLGATEVVQSHR